MKDPKEAANFEAITTLFESTLFNLEQISLLQKRIKHLRICLLLLCSAHIFEGSVALYQLYVK